MTSLLSKKQIYMEGGYMIGKIVLGICLTALVIAFFYGIYMAIWGVWDEFH